MHINKISEVIIGCAIKIHRKLGPGLLESAYHQCLFHELMKAEIGVRSQVPRPIEYDDIRLDHGYKLDLLVEDLVVVELKTVDAFTDVHFAQVATYLKLGKYPLGLLINFNVALLKNGIKRIINSGALSNSERSPRSSA